VNQDNVMHHDTEAISELKEKLERAAPKRSLAEELRRDLEIIELVANKQGLAVDFSKLDYEKLAAEVMDESRDVEGWDPPPAPKSWREVTRDPRGAKYVNHERRLTVILSCSFENDSRAWLHLSVSHKERIPTWGELGIAKAAFLGDREAYQVMPPRARYVNIHPYVLNVFALLRGEALPDFTRGTGGI
jgi:hypothetical protein